MDRILPKSSSLSSSCGIEVQTNYFSEEGKLISKSSIMTAQSLGFDVDSKFTKKQQLYIDLRSSGTSITNATISNIMLLKEAFLQLRNPNDKTASNLSEKILQLPEGGYNDINQSWFIVTKNPIEDIEITFPNGDTSLLTCKQLKSKMWSSIVPNMYYQTSCRLKNINGYEVVYFSNDYVKIGCNKIKLDIVISYLEDIELQYNLLHESLGDL